MATVATVQRDQAEPRFSTMARLGRPANAWCLMPQFPIGQRYVLATIGDSSPTDFPLPDNKPTCRDILVATSAAFRLPISTILGRSRAYHIARFRQLAMYVARRRTDASFPQIARYFGRMDHTTAIWAYRVTRARLEDPEWQIRLRLLEDTIPAAIAYRRAKTAAGMMTGLVVGRSAYEARTVTGRV